MMIVMPNIMRVDVLNGTKTSEYLEPQSPF